MTRTRVLVAAIALAAGGLAATPANAASSAICEPFAPPSSAAVQGNGSWSPPVTSVSTGHSWSMSVQANCTQGYGHDVGVYTFGLNGTSTEDCGVGNGTGTVTGSGPDGAIAGTISFYKIGVHYYMSGNFTSGGHAHDLALWIDVIPTIAGEDVCYYGNVPVFGHGVVSSTEPRATGDCRFRALQQEDATGQNFEGAAAGFAVNESGGDVSIRCYIEVNGAEASSTPTGTGPGFAETAGRLTYFAGDTDVVRFCKEIGTAQGVQRTCNDTTRVQVPPQEVWDLVDGIVVEYVDPAVCAVLAGFAGTYGPVTVNEQGDVYVNGELEWDCPPYGA